MARNPRIVVFGEDVADATRADALAQVLRALLAQLSSPQREALLLQHMEQLTVPEIAVVMGRSPASVKSLLQRGRETLRRRGHGYFLDDDEGGAP